MCKVFHHVWRFFNRYFFRYSICPLLSLPSSFGTPLMSNTGHVSKENSPLDCGKFSGRGQETRRGLKVVLLNKLSGLWAWALGSVLCTALLMPAALSFLRLSFYSGHSSFGMYCMMFLAVSWLSCALLGVALCWASVSSSIKRGWWRGLVGLSGLFIKTGGPGSSLLLALGYPLGLLLALGIGHGVSPAGS